MAPVLDRQVPARVRSPRVRATAINVQLGVKAELHELEPFTFGDTEEERRFARTDLLRSAFLPGQKQIDPGMRCSDDQLMTCLEELASSYRGWRAEPYPSRAEARSQLLQLRDAAAEWELAGDIPEDDLSKRVGELNRTALEALLPRLWKYAPFSPGYGCADDPKLTAKTLIEILDTVLEHLPAGGSYRDTTLFLTISALIALHRDYTGRTPLVGRDPSWLPALQFAVTFFNKVDPAIKPSTVRNAYEMIVLKRKARVLAHNARLAQSFGPPFPEGIIAL